MKGFGGRLRETLKEKGMSRREFRDLSGISEAAVSRYINGINYPQSKILETMSSVLGVSAYYLIHGNGDTDRGNRKNQYYTIADSKGAVVVKGISQDILKDTMAILFGDDPNETFSIRLEKR